MITTVQASTPSPSSTLGAEATVRSTESRASKSKQAQEAARAELATHISNQITLSLIFSNGYLLNGLASFTPEQLKQAGKDGTWAIVKQHLSTLYQGTMEHIKAEQQAKDLNATKCTRLCNRISMLYTRASFNLHFIGLYLRCLIANAVLEECIHFNVDRIFKEALSHAEKFLKERYVINPQAHLSVKDTLPFQLTEGVNQILLTMLEETRVFAAQQAEVGSAPKPLADFMQKDFAINDEILKKWAEKLVDTCIPGIRLFPRAKHPNFLQSKLYALYDKIEANIFNRYLKPLLKAHLPGVVVSLTKSASKEGGEPRSILSRPSVQLAIKSAIHSTLKVAFTLVANKEGSTPSRGTEQPSPTSACPQEIRDNLRQILENFFRVSERASIDLRPGEAATPDRIGSLRTQMAEQIAGSISSGRADQVFIARTVDSIITDLVVSQGADALASFEKEENLQMVLGSVFDICSSVLTVSNPSDEEITRRLAEVDSNIYRELHELGACITRNTLATQARGITVTGSALMRMEEEDSLKGLKLEYTTLRHHAQDLIDKLTSKLTSAEFDASIQGDIDALCHRIQKMNALLEMYERRSSISKEVLDQLLTKLGRVQRLAIPQLLTYTDRPISGFDSGERASLLAELQTLSTDLNTQIDQLGVLEASSYEKEQLATSGTKALLIMGVGIAAVTTVAAPALGLVAAGGWAAWSLGMLGWGSAATGAIYPLVTAVRSEAVPRYAQAAHEHIQEHRVQPIRTLIGRSYLYEGLMSGVLQGADKLVSAS